MEIGNRLVDESSRVEIRLSGILARYSSAGKVVTVDAGQTISEVVGNLGIPSNQPFVALVNGRTSDLGYRLAPADQLRLIPIIGGGGY